MWRDLKSSWRPSRQSRKKNRSCRRRPLKVRAECCMPQAVHPSGTQLSTAYAQAQQNGDRQLFIQEATVNKSMHCIPGLQACP